MKCRLLLLALLASCGGERPNTENPPPPPVLRMAALAAVPTPRFTIGQGVKTTQAAYVRSTPFHGNTSSNVLATAPVGATGTIMGGPVLDTSSDGDRWSRWDVAFAGTLPRGWVADTYLVATTVPPPPALVVTTVTVQPAAASVLVGVTVPLTATARDQNGAVMVGQSFTWASAAPSIAIVSGGGAVTGLAAGSTTIRATDAGKSGQALVTVTAPPPPPPPAVAGITVSPVSASIRLGEAQVLRFSATVFDVSGAVVAKPVVWSSGAATVATVDTAGWITTVGLGSTLITATIGAVQASGQVTVMAREPPPFNGIYATLTLQNGRLTISRQPVVSGPPILVVAQDAVADSLGVFGGSAFLVRPAMAPIYAAALRQLAQDVPGLVDTLRFQTANALATATVFCLPSGCGVATTTPGHAAWTSRPMMSPASLLGLAHALEAASRGDTLFAPGDSLPYVRSVP
jgi:Big-like domain-containing protein